jgi:hypothetical protein
MKAQGFVPAAVETCSLMCGGLLIVRWLRTGGYAVAAANTGELCRACKGDGHDVAQQGSVFKKLVWGECKVCHGYGRITNIRF